MQILKTQFSLQCIVMYKWIVVNVCKLKNQTIILFLCSSETEWDCRRNERSSRTHFWHGYQIWIKVIIIDANTFLSWRCSLSATCINSAVFFVPTFVIEQLLFILYVFNSDLHMTVCVLHSGWYLSTCLKQRVYLVPRLFSTDCYW